MNREEKVHQVFQNHPVVGKDIFEVKIQLFQEQPNKIPPLVAYFPSGYNPCKINPQNQQEEEGDGEGPSYQSNPPRVNVFRNMALKKTNRLQVVVSPSGCNVDFLGSSYSGEAAAAQVSGTHLGFLIRKPGFSTLFPLLLTRYLHWIREFEAQRLQVRMLQIQ